MLIWTCSGESSRSAALLLEGGGWNCYPADMKSIHFAAGLVLGIVAGWFFKPEPVVPEPAVIKNLGGSIVVEQGGKVFAASNGSWVELFPRGKVIEVFPAADVRAD